MLNGKRQLVPGPLCASYAPVLPVLDDRRISVLPRIHVRIWQSAPGVAPNMQRITASTRHCTCSSRRTLCLS